MQPCTLPMPQGEAIRWEDEENTPDPSPEEEVVLTPNPDIIQELNLAPETVEEALIAELLQSLGEGVAAGSADLAPPGTTPADPTEKLVKRGGKRGRRQLRALARQGLIPLEKALPFVHVTTEKRVQARFVDSLRKEREAAQQRP